MPAVKRGRKIDLSVGGWGELSWAHKLQLVAPAKSDWEPDGTEAAMQRVVRAVQEAAASAPLQGSEVDRRLWRGAAAQGWSMQCRDLRATLWCYTAPDGARLLSRSEVFGWQQAHAPPHLKLAGTAEDYAGQGRPPAFRLLSEAQAAPPRQHGAPGEGEGEELVPIARPPPIPVPAHVPGHVPGQVPGHVPGQVPGQVPGGARPTPLPAPLSQVVPAGFALAPPPSAEELAPGSAAGARLVGCALLFKWEGIGWCRGEITRQNRDDNERIDGDMANFFAFYEVDGQEAAHVLGRGAYYRLATSGEAASWVLLRAQQEAEAEEQQRQQQQQQQQQLKHAKRQAWRQAQLQARQQQQPQQAEHGGV